MAGRPSGAGNVDYGFDAAGRALTMTDGMGRTWTNSLTNGRLSSVQRPDGSLLSLAYDASGRLQSMSASGDTRSFTYDAAGLIATASTSAGTTRVLRNHRGQIVQREDEFGYVVLAGYDAAGQLVSLTYDGLTVTYTYDRDGLLLRMADSSNRVVEYGHDTAGRLVRATYPNGVVTTITRDAAGRMTGLQHEKSGVVLAAWTITLNALGNRTRVIQTAGAVTWNLPNSVRDFTVSPTGQVQTQSGSSSQYDAQGCMTTWPSSAGTRTLTHTAYGRLANMIGGGFSTAYRYDADGEVLALMRNGTETRFLQDLTGPMSRILAEKTASNATVARYVYGLGLTYRIEAGTNAVRFYHADPNGNVVLLTDENGAPTDRYAYTPFGETVGVVGSSANPFRFGGSLGVFDAGDGTLVMRRRVYAPELGRFLSPDPVEQPLEAPQARNVYSYALGNPWGFVDPTGMTGERDDMGGTGATRLSSYGGITLGSEWDNQMIHRLLNDPTIPASRKDQLTQQLHAYANDTTVGDAWEGVDSFGRRAQIQMIKAGLGSIATLATSGAGAVALIVTEMQVYESLGATFQMPAAPPGSTFHTSLAFDARELAVSSNRLAQLGFLDYYGGSGAQLSRYATALGRFAKSVGAGLVADGVTYVIDRTNAVNHLR